MNVCVCVFMCGVCVCLCVVSVRRYADNIICDMLAHFKFPMFSHL